jgi:hypothetical protein
MISKKTQQAYKRHFPDINIEKEELSIEEVERILLYLNSGLNINYFKDFICNLDRKFPTIDFYAKSLEKLIRDRKNELSFTKREYKTSEVEYWIIRGWTEEEAIKKSNAIKSVSHDRVKNERTFYKNLGIDINKSQISDEDVLLCINSIVKDVKPNSAVEQKLVDAIKDRSYPTRKYIKECISEILGTKRFSRMCIDYWIRKGYTIEEAQERINYTTQHTSKLCKGYWINKGYSNEVAEQKIIEFQTQNSLKALERYNNLTDEDKRKKNPSTKEYWTNKGYSEDEATLKIRQLNFYTLEYWINKGYTPNEASNKRKLCVKESSPYFKDYWQKRKNLTEKDAIEKARETRQKFSKNMFLSSNFSSYRSKIADEVFSQLKQLFPNNNILTKDNELRVIINKSYRYYDYVDFTKKVVVEFNGDYWHSEYFPRTQHVDTLKKDYAENEMKFRFYTIKEHDYRKNPQKVIMDVYNFIMEEKSNED